MIDTKYALKYQMPHSLLHIVDNSMYTGTLATAVVDDPSLYATIVVTGAPMGVDNRFVNLTRADVASVSFGLGDISTDDIKRFGQTVQYPMSLLQNSNAPVRFMRVTPDGSTYALYTILVQWKVEDDKFLVRFEQQPFSDLSSLRLDRFKNTDRLNSAIIAAVKDLTPPEGWNQTVFMNIISAGRGKAYNDMAFTIDLGTQQKRALNCRYIFSTINTLTTQVIETFAASLVNNNVGTRITSTTTPLDSVNVAVGRRMDGSSILVPYVNEDAVATVFNAYMEFINTKTSELTENELRMIKTTNVNTFDILFGNYIYDGAEYAMKLPRYQVEMYDVNIERLDENHRVFMWEDQYTIEDGNKVVYNPTALYDKLIAESYGITRDSDETYVGDIYITPMANGVVNPYVTLVAAINQYTGAITQINVNGINEGGNTVGIVAYFNDVTPTNDTWTTSDDDKTAINTSATLKTLIANGTIQADTPVYVVYVNPNVGVDDENKIQLVKINYNSTNNITIDANALVGDDIRKNIAIKGSNSVIKIDTTAATGNVGTTLIDSATGAVYVFDYEGNPTIAIANASIKFATLNQTISSTNDLIGVEYDVMVYKPDATDLTMTLTGYDSIVAGGTGYAVDDELKIDNANLDGFVLKVSAVTSGAITALTIETNTSAYNEEIATFIADPTNLEELALVYKDSGSGTGAKIKLLPGNLTPNTSDASPSDIDRWVVTGVNGSLYRVQKDDNTDVPYDYYTAEYGINPTSANSGLQLSLGSTGFFDRDLNSIVFKYKYSALLVKAYKGQIDPRIMSPMRCPAKFLFDGATNTVIGQNMLPNQNYYAADIINASTIFTDDEKDAILINPEIIADISYPAEDIDVKQAMYDLMIERAYLRIPEDKRPLGPGYGLSLHLDSGVTDAATVKMINTSFSKRFTNPNASWDIGGYVSADNGISYTYTKWLADNLIAHCKTYTINKPFAMTYASIPSNAYTSYFPDIDMTDWELREFLYNSGGNAWVPDVNGNLVRRSQRTMQTYEETSDLVQESNMRTLSQLCYLLQNKIDSKLLEYDDDDVLKTLSDEVNQMFINWQGNLVQSLEITFERDTNPTDGGDIVVCYCNVTFRGLILRVPIIVNIQRRSTT